MPQAKTIQSKISAIHTTVGSILKKIDDDIENFGGNVSQIETIKKTIGLNERRVVDQNTTAADLCENSARTLIEELKLNPDEIDALICVTQTPDHFQPCNAAILHGRLKLSKSCAAFDVTLGCSGYVYGLYLSSIMIESGGCKKILLLAGDTMSRCVNPKDRSTASLFGDAGSATLVEYSETENSIWFDLHTNGQGSDYIIIPAGGFRNPASDKTKISTIDCDGNTRSPENLFMNGAEIFNFSIKEEPQAIRKILELSGKKIDEIDYIFFHQANKYIISNIARRLKLPIERAPYQTVEKYGNQSSASIPATICETYNQESKNNLNTVILSGFGVGLSWATSLMELNQLKFCSLELYKV